MSEMVQRLAKAMLVELERQYRDLGIPYVSGHDTCLNAVIVDGHVDLLTLARAAIIAIREPIVVMLEAAKVADPLGCDVDPGDETTVYGAIWRGMIDAAGEGSK